MRPSRPKKEANRPDYYTHTEKGGRDETAEDALKVIESRVAPFVQKLANPQYALTPENAAHLIVFVGSMFARVPSWRECVDQKAAEMAKTRHIEAANDKGKFYETCAEMERATGKTLGITYEQLRQSILNDDYELVQALT
jgi:hypothetical protein